MADPIPREALVANRRSHQLLMHIVLGDYLAAERLLSAVPDGLDLELVEYSLHTIAPGVASPDIADPRRRVAHLAQDAADTLRRPFVTDEDLARNLASAAERSYRLSEQPT